MARGDSLNHLLLLFYLKKTMVFNCVWNSRLGPLNHCGAFFAQISGGVLVTAIWGYILEAEHDKLLIIIFVVVWSPRALQHYFSLAKMGDTHWQLVVWCDPGDIFVCLFRCSIARQICGSIFTWFWFPFKSPWISFEAIWDQITPEDSNNIEYGLCKQYLCDRIILQPSSTI